MSYKVFDLIYLPLLAPHRSIPLPYPLNFVSSFFKPSRPMCAAQIVLVVFSSIGACQHTRAQLPYLPAASLPGVGLVCAVTVAVP